jgi:hypothetical protein
MEGLMLRTCLTVSCITALLLSGCVKKAIELLPPDPPEIAPVTIQEHINLRRLGGVAPTVRDRFVREHSSAAVVNVNFLTAATGMPVYEINFLHPDGRPDEVRYTVTGKIIQLARE